MASSPPLVMKLPFLFFIISISCLLLIHTSSSTSTINNDYLEAECLNVPTTQFLGSLQSAITGVRQVTSVVSKYGNIFGDFRLSNAISDCLDLLDSTSDDLTWTVSASQNPTGKHNSTGDLSSDLRTWISASLTNQATCIEGFDGTNGIVKTIVKASMTQINSLTTQLLTMVNPKTPKHSTTRGRELTTDDGFPSWVPHNDRRLIQINGVPADVIVAQDGTGNFTNITAAVLSAPNYNTTRYVIYIKKGVYNEYVEIKKKKWNIMMVGEGIGVTVITGNHNNVDGWTTFRSATFAVSARGFIARDITFENTAGPDKHQAVALRSDSDLSVFFRCEMKGYQDTLYTHTMRQFFRECKISGTVDFIFGDGTVVFQNCFIQALKGLSNQKNTITAQGRKDPNQPTGFSIQFCNISAETALLQANATQTYLGRPWKLYSRTIFMQNYLSNIIHPAGWLEMNGSQGLDTLYYGEYMNYGPGAGTGGRVTWPGYHLLNTSAQANNFTVSQFIEGNLWLPSTGVKYTAGLTE